MSELHVYETWTELYGRVEAVVTDAPSGLRLVNADDYDTLQSVRDDLRQKLTDREREQEELVKSLEDANSLCRSAMEIAKRESTHSETTNWEAFMARIGKSLIVQQNTLNKIKAREAEG